MKNPFQKDALFSGMSSNAFKLGTILNLGWFWQRLSGCTLLYRCAEFLPDGEHVIAVFDIETQQVSPPHYMTHQDNSAYYYLVRRANCCGDIERTQFASAKLVIN